MKKHWHDITCALPSLYGRITGNGSNPPGVEFHAALADNGSDEISLRMVS